MELWMTTRAVGDHTVLEVRGEVDIYTAPRLRERLAELTEEGKSRLVLDLNRVEESGATGRVR